MIGVTAAASAGIYFSRGDIDPFVAAPVALGVLAGSLFGARILPRIAGVGIRIAFFVVIAVISRADAPARPGSRSDEAKPDEGPLRATRRSGSLRPVEKAVSLVLRIGVIAERGDHLSRARALAKGASRTGRIDAAIPILGALRRPSLGPPRPRSRLRHHSRPGGLDRDALRPRRRLDRRLRPRAGLAICRHNGHRARRACHGPRPREEPGLAPSLRRHSGKSVERQMVQQHVLHVENPALSAKAAIVSGFIRCASGGPCGSSR